MGNNTSIKHENGNDANLLLYAGWRCEISSKKQDNGLWGMPLQCVKMDGIPMNTSKENWLKHSAICIGIAEAYRDETFELFWTDEKGFSVRLSKSGMKTIRYDDYKLEDNVLTWVGQPACV